MIIVAGWLDLDPEQRGAALAAGRPHVEGARAQPGCLDYVWSEDALVPGRIYVYERWESQEALEAHFRGPHYRAMRETMGAHGIRNVQVAKHRVSRSEPVYDAAGRPRADFTGDPV